MAIFERDYQNFGSKCGHKKANFWSKMWSWIAKTRGSLNSMTNNSKNCWEGFKVVVEDRWSLNSSGP